MLDMTWIDMIFTKLTLVYGTRFSAQWQGVSVDAVKADWAHELSGCTAEGIKHALHNLPRDFPPNVLTFRDLTVSRRLPEFRALPAPQDLTPIPAKVARNLAGLACGSKADPLAWARRLRNRELLGQRLTKAQQAMWRAALDYREERATDERATEGGAGRAVDS